ncbi:MAG TPA: aminotransferase class V-fold PLP-dependent enzyme, partial [Thermoanaerobaculia bacterium]|nr:aminotransferase class V-fold PLP-dependent enzyme [Thermoanaerobaculia bacterium]
MPLEFYEETLLRRAMHHAAGFLRQLPDRPVGPRATREELMRALAVPLTEEGDDDIAVLDALASAAERGTMATAGPRFFGFVIGGSLPVTVATDWMVSAWDQNTGIYVASPLASVIEDVAREWLLDILQLPRESGLGFTTGGQMSNFTCLAAARHGVLRAAGWNVEQDGLQGAPKVNVVVSAESHITIDVSLRYLGLGANSIHVPADEEGRMRAGELRETLRRLSGPTIVCAQAGNINTGAFDPLRDIADATREHGAWLHVDGAFGLWAAASRRKRPLVDGLELANSWATDAHKWLNVPYDCGIAIVRDSAAHRASMTSHAAYLEQTVGQERDNFDWAPEFSRRGRGFAVYSALRTLGRLGVEDL